MKSARQLAFETLTKMEKQDAYSNLSVAGVLKGHALGDADKSLFTALVYGVTERRITLDYNLSRYLAQPLKKLKPEVLTILRLGAYQLLFMEKIPSHAAINESVELARKNRASYAAGLVNAVLRKVSADGLQLPEKPADTSGEEYIKYLETVYSCPGELIKLWLFAYGKENTVGILEHANGPQKIYGRHKTKGTVILTEKDLSNLSSDIHVQDKSSQIFCESVGVKPGDRVFDMCAAPGGKSFTLAELMNNEGEILSFDRYEHRVKLIGEGAKRLGLTSVHAAVNDAEQYNETLGEADVVLCDVPCSGFGDIGKKPEIRYKKRKDVENFPALQYNILINSARYVKSGGRLCYSTCTLNPAENEEIISRFLREYADFTLLSQRTVFPQEEDCDGFFYAVMTKG